LAGGVAPLTGGNGEEAAFGSGAGNAPCAQAAVAWTASTANVSGAIRRRMIKRVPQGNMRFAAVLRSLPTVNNPSNWATARRKAAPDHDNCV
jgi:hypothetical protein